jgi:dTDP-4-dehydrorhamnose 3,5-epimerase
MTFTETKLQGAFIIDIERFEDERGFFANTFTHEKFKELGLPTQFSQCSISFNKKKGILRGMHYQLSPKAQPKYVRCTKGSVYDVIIDLRPESATFCQWISVELSDDNHKILYIPRGFAHGFQTLTEKSEIFYQISEDYVPELASGVRWNDLKFNITWPNPSPILSERDASYPDFVP